MMIFITFWEKTMWYICCICIVYTLNNSLSKDTCVVSLIPQNTFLKQQLMALFSWKLLQMFKFGSPMNRFLCLVPLFDLCVSWWEISICRPHWYYRCISTGIFICLIAHLSKTRFFWDLKEDFNGPQGGRKKNLCLF